MKIIAAENSGFCYGVSRTIEMAEKAAAEAGKCYTLGHIIHNKDVVRRLAEKGITAAERIEDIPPGSTVIIRSHGVGRAVLEKLARGDYSVIDATCPNVSRIHKLAAQASEEGRTVLIIGTPGHPEIEGIRGWCAEAYVAQNAEELEEWLAGAPERRDRPISMVFQTTSRKEINESCVKIIKKECTNAKIFDTMCVATSRRQEEARRLSAECSCMVVVGDTLSANTRRLAEICAERCPRVCFVENAEGLENLSFDEHDTIGIVAGASTPAWTIKEVNKKMCEEFKNQELNMENQAEQEEVISTAAAEPESVVEETNQAAEGGESFAELLEKSIKTLRTGDKVTGTVAAITATEISVDLGTKHAGYIPVDEFTNEPGAKIEDLVHVGDQIEAYVMRVNDVEGTAELSKKRLDMVKTWADIETFCEEKTTVEGVITDENKGGVVASVKGVRVFIPASQTGLPRGAETSSLLKKTVRMRITEVNRARHRVVGSIRAVQFEERRARAEQIWNEIEVGKKYTGVVKSLTSYGAFVDIGGIDGMIHVSELSWTRISNPAEVLSVGQEVEVYVISFDKEKKKISLGYRREEDNPWTRFMNTYEVGSVAKVKIVKLMDFGAFAEVLPGVDGLIHISQIADHRIGKPADVLTVGEEVDAKIVNIDTEKKKISLSIRALLEPAADEAAEEAPAEEAPAEEEAPVEAE